MTELHTTLAALTALTAATVFAGWLGARPLDFSRQGRPRLIPWRGLMLVLATAAIIALVHALNLIGVSTGDRR